MYTVYKNIPEYVLAVLGASLYSTNNITVPYKRGTHHPVKRRVIVWLQTLRVASVIVSQLVEGLRP